MMNKKFIILLVAVLCISITCFGCSTNSDNNDNGKQEINGEQETPPVKENGEETSGDKTGMTRINIFETGITDLDTVEVDNKGTSVDAYAIKDYVDKVFTATPTGDVVMIASDGYSISANSEEFMEDFIIMEGESAPLSINSRAKYLQYIKIDKESICFVEDSLKVDDIFSALGMEEADNYKFIASDGFSMDVAKGDIAECTLVKKDKTVNASIPALSGGDLREILYIESIQ